MSDDKRKPAQPARTASQRQADYIANKQRQGLKQIRNLWAKPEDHAKVREFVAKLNAR